MNFPGAPSALRGYRLQHLYSLFRILSSEAPKSRGFQLEGSEDLEIFDEAGDLLEAVQVKSRSNSPLAPSALVSKAGESFFKRSAERLQEHPAALQRIVSFGNVGPTLMMLGDPQDIRHQEKTVELQRLGIPPDLIETFIRALKVELAKEADIERDVLARLASTVTGCNPEAAFLYLSGWMYQQMEKRQRLTAADVHERLLAVGRFVADAQAHASEWFTTIVPLEANAVESSRRNELAHEFYEGVSARAEHILADIDVERSTQLHAIEVAFERSNVVILHGASGQGKTALALRYVLHSSPAAWKFQIRELGDALQARRVALALRGHADAIGVPMIVWFDVAPQDTSWVRVVDEIQSLPNTRVLIAIREEDWSRATKTGAILRYADVELKLGRNEARQVFDQLQQYRVSGDFLDFEDAWRRFGSHGPLMEFTYLVTRGGAFHSKLQHQTNRLREDVRAGRLTPTELELLRRIAVGTTTGGRLQLRGLVSDLQLGDAKTSLDLFEREYLLRVSSDRRYVEGLHPLRSQTIARLLTDDSAFDPSWLDCAIAVLPSIDESDLEPFLLLLFEQHPTDDVLQHALAHLCPATWWGAAAVVRALLWRGVREYVNRNHALIQEITATNSGEFPLMVLDPAGLETFAPSLERLLHDIFSASPELSALYDDLRRRKPANTVVTYEAFRWLRTANLDFGEPALPKDWPGIAEILFWISAAGLESPDRAKTFSRAITRSAESASLERAAELFFALSFWRNRQLFDGLEDARHRLLERFQQELQVFAIERTEKGIVAHYIAPAGEPDLNKETLRRIDLLRGLLPDESGYGGQAYGHLFGTSLFEHDPSMKRGISPDTFAVPWPVRLSRLFTSLARPGGPAGGWSEYVEAIVQIRRDVVSLSNTITRALRRYFARDKPRTIFELGVDPQTWINLETRLTAVPRLPASVADEWGIEVDKIIVDKITSPQLASRLEKHEGWERALSAFTNAFATFLSHSAPYFVANAHIGRPYPKAKQVADAALRGVTYQVTAPTLQLSVAVTSMVSLQRDFRSRFQRFVRADDLAKLEADEREQLWGLWLIWFQFSHRSRQYLSDAVRDSLAAASAMLDQRRRQLIDRLAAITCARVSLLHERKWPDPQPGLWITMDVGQRTLTAEAREQTVRAILEALRPPLDLHAFERYVLDMAWRDVHVIPLVRGKALRRIQWMFRIATLPQAYSQFESWQLLERPIDDELQWDELGVPEWPSTLAGATRRFCGELATGGIELSLYLRLALAPSPTDCGEAVLATHWKHVSTAFDERVKRAAEDLTAIPSAIFTDGEDSINALRTIMTRVADGVRTSSSGDFDEIAKLASELAKVSSEALPLIADLAVDYELKRDESPLNLST